MATKQEKDDAAKKAADEKEQAGARFTRERLQADLNQLQGQAQQAEQMLARAQAAVAQWQGKLQAIVGAHSYCTELLQAYGVEAKPLPDTKPADTKAKRGRKLKALPNGSIPAASSGSEAPKVE